MPLTLTLTEGALPAGDEKLAFRRLSDAMLKWHGLSENAAIAPNIIGSLSVLPQGTVFSGGEPAMAAFVEWKTPSFAFADRAAQVGYFAEATEILHHMSGGKLLREKIFINVVHAVDGAWNFDGRAMTNAEIGAAVAAG